MPNASQNERAEQSERLAMNFDPTSEPSFRGAQHGLEAFAAATPGKQ